MTLWLYAIGFWIQLSFLCQRDNAFVALQFRCECLRADARDLVVDAAFIVHFRVDAFIAFTNQTRVEHPLERAVQCAWSHRNLPMRICLDLFHDPIAVTLPAGEREEDVEHGGRKWLVGIVCSHNSLWSNSSLGRNYEVMERVSLEQKFQGLRYTINSKFHPNQEEHGHSGDNRDHSMDRVCELSHSEINRKTRAE